MSTIRKALSAGLAAALSVLFTGLATEVPKTQAGWLALGGAALTAGVVTAYGVWRVPNEVPTVQPVTTPRRY